MSLNGLKKQWNKANQMVSEKIGGAEGTKATEEYIQLERKTDLIQSVVNEMVTKTKEVLYPNPTLRAKLAVNTKLMGNKNDNYPHPEHDLADCMTKYGSQFDSTSKFGQSLVEIGDTFKQLTDAKYSLENNVKRDFLEPLGRLQSKDLKDCAQHRRKLEGRRLDYDCKRRRTKSNDTNDSELKLAESKYNESYNLATIAMKNLLDNEDEQFQYMTGLTQALHDYHTNCADILQNLITKLSHKRESNSGSMGTAISDVWNKSVNKVTECADQYQGVFGLMKLNNDINKNVKNVNNSSNTSNNNNTSAVLLKSQTNSVKNISQRLYPPITADKPVIKLNKPVINRDKPKSKCRALYDFEAENADELAFKMGDVIELKTQIDDNWFEGILNGKTGLFPVSYVQVLVPLKS